MDFTTNAWYVRYYLWSLGVWAAYRMNKDVWRDFKKGTTLCHFMRVCLVYAPLIVLQHLTVALAAISILTWLPVYLFGWGEVSTTVLIIGGILLSCAALVATVIYGIKGAQLLHSKIESKVQDISNKPNPPSLVVAWQYLKAIKGKYCPIITIATKEIA